MTLDRFSAIVAEEELSLAEAFLAFAAAEYPGLRPDTYLLALDRLGDDVGSRVAASAEPAERLRVLSERLSELGFHGAGEDYYDPRNSFLNEVLERRTGIPISLSVLWIEVGLRAGVTILGVGMPMHFLVGLQEGVFADPFHGGTPMSAEEAMLLFAEVTDGEVPWRDEYLAPTAGRDIVRRALSNLKAVYGTQGDMLRVLWVEDHLLAIPGTADAELVERATVLQALRRFPEAIADLRTYVRSHPEDTEKIEPRIRRLQAAMN